MASAPTSPTACPPPATPAPAPSLTATATRGFVWMAAQTIGAKGIGMVGQIILAWLLAPEDFGLIALAYTVTTFVGLLQQAGIREVLIARQRRFDRWATAAFWMSLTLGVAGAVLMLMAAPAAAALYGQSRIIGPIAVLAIAAPIASLSLVPMAWLQVHLRFKLLAGLGLFSNTLSIVLSIVFAWLGFGVYSFVLPRPIVAVLEALVVWRVARPPIKRRLHLGRWRYILVDSGVLLGVALVFTAVSQGGSIVLGLAGVQKAQIGLYFWAYNLSLQSLQLLSTSLQQVLFPSLTKLQDDIPRQTQAFLRATRLLSLVVTPVCLLQAAVADPVVRLIFDDDWIPAIPMLQVLSVGMGFVAVTAPAGSLLQAQGRFRTYFGLSVLCAVLFFTLSSIGGRLAQGFGVAAGCAMYLMIATPINLALAIRPAGLGWGTVFRTLAPSAALSAVCVAAAYQAQQWLRSTTTSEPALIAVTVAVAAALYVPAARLLLRDQFNDLWRLGMGIVRRGR